MLLSRVPRGPAASSCLFSAPLATLAFVVLLHLTFLLRLLHFYAAYVPWGEEKGHGRDGVFSVPVLVSWAEDAGQSRSSLRCQDGTRLAEVDSSRDYQTWKNPLVTH